MKHIIQPIVFGIALLGMSFAHASCPAPKLTPPEEVKLTGPSVLIVTHGTASFDPRYSIKYGLDAAVRYAKSHDIPIVYMIDDSPIQLYEMEDCNPDYWVYSKDGEVPFKVRPSHVYLAGGHLEQCLSQTANEILYRKMRHRRPEVRYTFFMDAIYSNGKSFDLSDPYYNDYFSFMSIISYGRPSGETGPRLNLLESLGAIKSLDYQYDYLKKVSPKWETTVPNDYEVSLRLYGLGKELLRKGNELFPPRIEFTFVESADLLQ